MWQADHADQIDLSVNASAHQNVFIFLCAKTKGAHIEKFRIKLQSIHSKNMFFTLFSLEWTLKVEKHQKQRKKIFLRVQQIRKHRHVGWLLTKKNHLNLLVKLAFRIALYILRAFVARLRKRLHCHCLCNWMCRFVVAIFLFKIAVENYAMIRFDAAFFLFSVDVSYWNLFWCDAKSLIYEIHPFAKCIKHGISTSFVLRMFQLPVISVVYK